MPADPDFELLRRWREGDREAGDRLVTKYYAPVRRFFTNSVGDDQFQDLTNETFTRLTTAKEGFEGASSVRTFLFSIARRTLFDHLRKRYRQDARGFDPLTHTVEDVDGATPSRAVVQLEQYRRLLGCLRALPVEQKLLLELYYWHDCRAAELAEVHHVEPGTVRTRIHAAKRRLARCLSQGAEAIAGSPEPEPDEIADDDRLDRDLRSVGQLLVRGPVDVQGL